MGLREKTGLLRERYSELPIIPLFFGGGFCYDIREGKRKKERCREEGEEKEKKGIGGVSPF